MGSLNIQIKTEEELSSFLVYECTGKYSSENTGGFGGSNHRANQITKSTLYIKGPNDDDYKHVIDVTGTLPNNNNIAYQVLPTQIGQQDELESGQYKFKLEHVIKTTDGPEVTETGYGVDVFIKNIVCCIDKLGPIDAGKDAFKDLKQKKILELNNLIESVNYQIEKGLYDAANKTIDYLKSQCKCNGCK
jgi:hypothetical protein